MSPVKEVTDGPVVTALDTELHILPMWTVCGAALFALVDEVRPCRGYFVMTGPVGMDSKSICSYFWNGKGWVLSDTCRDPRSIAGGTGA